MHFVGGARCIVAPGTCTVLPQKAASFGTASTGHGNVPTIGTRGLGRSVYILNFLGIAEQCADPYNDAGREALESIEQEVVPALQRKGLTFTTQAQCSCTPEYWNYHPPTGGVEGAGTYDWQGSAGRV